MSMSKKDFIALADCLKGAQVFNNADTIEIADDLKARLIYFMQAQNPRFMSDRWLAYLNGECGPGGGKIKPKENN